MIVLLNTIINLLTSEPNVIVISLDFSKAFDAVRHSLLLHKLAQLDLADHIYNWLAEFFCIITLTALYSTINNHRC